MRISNFSENKNECFIHFFEFIPSNQPIMIHKADGERTIYMLSQSERVQQRFHLIHGEIGPKKEGLDRYVHILLKNRTIPEQPSLHIPTNAGHYDRINCKLSVKKWSQFPPRFETSLHHSASHSNNFVSLISIWRMTSLKCNSAWSRSK